MSQPDGMIVKETQEATHPTLWLYLPRLLQEARQQERLETTREYAALSDRNVAMPRTVSDERDGSMCQHLLSPRAVPKSLA